MLNASLDRFAQGLPDLQAQPEEVVAECACGCGLDILAGYRYLNADGEWFYDEECLFKHLRVERSVAG